LSSKITNNTSANHLAKLGLGVPSGSAKPQLGLWMGCSLFDRSHGLRGNAVSDAPRRITAGAGKDAFPRRSVGTIKLRLSMIYAQRMNAMTHKYTSNKKGNANNSVNKASGTN